MDPVRVCEICGKPAAADAPQGLCPACLMKSGFDTQGPGADAGQSPLAVLSIEEVTRLFPQLEIIELLGHGGMGAVYKARQPGLGRFVALKILPPQRASDPGFAERFNREARALARLSHPNIVSVYDFGQTGGLPYFIMEYVEGSTLREVVKAGGLPPEETLRVVIQICEALQFAHDEGVVHRDIKPENILLDSKGRVKIADFGIAKVLEQEQAEVSLTEAKDVMGTAHYMAPEQLENPQAVDHRADIFSLGVVFYELLTGELPLGKFAPPSQKTQTDERLDHVVMHSLEKEPERRYQQASQVQSDVENIAATPQGEKPAVQTSVQPSRPAPPLVQKRSVGIPLMIVLGVIALAGVLAVAGILIFYYVLQPTGGRAPFVSSLSQTNNSSAPLNADQRLVVQACTSKFQQYDDARTFAGWSESDREGLERRLLDEIKGPHSKQLYRGINSLAALHSTNALPTFRQMAFDHRESIVRLESSNRPRWMAVRAMGVMDDQEDVPRLIHLLYHNNGYVRWWAQISLVRLTGQNFGSDWKAWGDWWTTQNRQPQFSPAVVRWWRGQAEPDELAKILAAEDQKFLESMKAILAGRPVTDADEN